jgi:23S rRNA (adenine2030-N6)-methyltransferase
VRQADEKGFGMIGSSMLVINPPFVLHDMLQQTLPWLTDVLGQYDGAHFLLEQRAA